MEVLQAFCLQWGLGYPPARGNTSLCVMVPPRRATPWKKTSLPLSKYERNKEKAARLNRKADILQTKIDTLEHKNLKLDRKLKNIDTKQKISVEKDVYKETKKALSDAAKISSRDYLKGKISDKDYNDLMDLYGGAAA